MEEMPVEPPMTWRVTLTNCMKLIQKVRACQTHSFRLGRNAGSCRKRDPQTVSFTMITLYSMKRLSVYCFLRNGFLYIRLLTVKLGFFVPRKMTVSRWQKAFATEIGVKSIRIRSREVSSSCQGVKGVAMAILVCYWHDYDCTTIAYGMKSWRMHGGMKSCRQAAPPSTQSSWHREETRLYRNECSCIFWFGWTSGNIWKNRPSRETNEAW